MINNSLVSVSDPPGDSASLSDFPPVEERSGPEGAEEDVPDSSSQGPKKDDATTEEDDDSDAGRDVDEGDDEDDEECKSILDRTIGGVVKKSRTKKSRTK